MTFGHNKRTFTGGVLTISWFASALIAVVLLILGYAVLPPLFGASHSTAHLVNGGRTLFALLGLLFGSIAIYKLIAARSYRKLHPLPMAESVEEASTQSLPGAVTAQSPRDAWEHPEQVAILPPGGDWGSPKPISRFPLEPFPNAKPTDWSLELLEAIEWKRFEDLCAVYFREMGFRTETTPLSEEWGVEIRLHEMADNHDTTAIVQCKAWGDTWIGVQPLRDFHGVISHENIGQAFFVTPGGFTADARRFAEANQITLIDGRRFLEMILALPAESGMRLLAYATKGSYSVPTCPSCGMKMAPKTGPQGNYWCCRNYPDCPHTLAMRKPVSPSSPD